MENLYPKPISSTCSPLLSFLQKKRTENNNDLLNLIDPLEISKIILPQYQKLSKDEKKQYETVKIDDKIIDECKPEIKRKVKEEKKEEEELIPIEGKSNQEIFELLPRSFKNFYIQQNNGRISISSLIQAWKDLSREEQKKYIDSSNNNQNISTFGSGLGRSTFGTANTSRIPSGLIGTGAHISGPRQQLTPREKQGMSQDFVPYSFIKEEKSKLQGTINLATVADIKKKWAALSADDKKKYTKIEASQNNGKPDNQIPVKLGKPEQETTTPYISPFEKFRQKRIKELNKETKNDLQLSVQLIKEWENLSAEEKAKFSPENPTKFELQTRSTNNGPKTTVQKENQQPKPQLNQTNSSTQNQTTKTIEKSATTTTTTTEESTKSKSSATEKSSESTPKKNDADDIEIKDRKHLKSQSKSKSK